MFAENYLQIYWLAHVTTTKNTLLDKNIYGVNESPPCQKFNEILV